jgi:hypothetical protein
MSAIIPLTMLDSDSSAHMGNRIMRYNAGLAKSTISPVMLSQPSPGRIQGVNTVAIIILY